MVTPVVVGFLYILNFRLSMSLMTVKSKKFSLLSVSVSRVNWILDVYKRQVVLSLSQVYGTYSLTPDPNGIVGEGLY